MSKVYYVHIIKDGVNIDHTKVFKLSTIKIGKIWKPFGGTTHPPRYLIKEREKVDNMFEGKAELWRVYVEELKPEYDDWNGPNKPTQFDKHIGLINNILYGKSS